MGLISQMPTAINDCDKLVIDVWFNLPSEGLPSSGSAFCELFEFGGGGVAKNRSSIKAIIDQSAEYAAVSLTFIGPVKRTQVRLPSGIACLDEELGEDFLHANILRTVAATARVEFAAFLDRWHHLVLSLDVSGAEFLAYPLQSGGFQYTSVPSCVRDQYQNTEDTFYDFLEPPSAMDYFGPPSHAGTYIDLFIAPGPPERFFYTIATAVEITQPIVVSQTVPLCIAFDGKLRADIATGAIGSAYVSTTNFNIESGNFGFDGTDDSDGILIKNSEIGLPQQKTDWRSGLAAPPPAGWPLKKRYYQFQAWFGKYVDLTDAAVLEKFIAKSRDDSGRSVGNPPKLDAAAIAAYESANIPPAERLSLAAAPNFLGRPDLFFRGGKASFPNNRGSGFAFALTGTNRSFSPAPRNIPIPD
jgi:hypothetical protein